LVAGREGNCTVKSAGQPLGRNGKMESLSAVIEDGGGQREKRGEKLSEKAVLGK